MQLYLTKHKINETCVSNSDADSSLSDSKLSDEDEVKETMKAKWKLSLKMGWVVKGTWFATCISRFRETK